MELTIYYYILLYPKFLWLCIINFMKLLYRYNKKSNDVYSILLYPKLLQWQNSRHKIMNDIVLYW